MAIPRMTADVEMLDGSTHEGLRIIAADLIRHSDVARRHNWGSLEDDPLRAQLFLAYAAMTRLNLYPADTGFDQFIDECAMAMVGDDSDDGDELDPTR
jgi:hypothetical protein